MAESECQKTESSNVKDSDVRSRFYNYLTSLNNSEITQYLNFNYYTTGEFENLCKDTTRNVALSIFHLNIRSLNRNNEELFQLLQSMNFEFDIIVLSEIWSCNVDLYSQLFEGYTFYYDLPVTGYVGGIGIFVKNVLKQNQLNNVKIPSTADCKLENIWLEISKGGQKYVIGGIYRHPGQDIDKFTDSIEKIFLQLKKLKLPCLIAGDINIDLAKYDTHNPTSNYLENLLLYDITPTVVMPTRFTDQSATIIDHIYYLPGHRHSIGADLNIQSGNFWSDLTDHLPNFCLITSNNIKHCREENPLIRIYSATNVDKFRQTIKNTDWVDVLNCSDANTAYTNFENKIVAAFNDSFRLVRLSRKRYKDKKWITAGLLASSHTKNRLYKKWHKTRCALDEEKYKSYRKLFKRVANAAESSYYKDQFDTRTNTMKQLWSNLNRMFCLKKSKSKTVISNLRLDNKTVSNTEEICNGLNEFYCNIGTKLANSIPKSQCADFTKYCPTPYLNSMFCNPVAPNEIHNIIMTFKNKKSPGYDNIGSTILKEICPEIINVLTYIFNLSFVTGVVPDSLKLAKVIPVYKKGDRNEPGNYRPISLLSIFEKILEKLMSYRLLNYLNRNKILYEFQFGFRKHHSTILALIEVIDNIYQQLDKNEYVMGIFFDLQKAFDTVNHDILLYKLYNYGIRGVVYQWFKCYLNNRRQFTSLGDIVSNVGYIITGVPQGSVLGPLLFLIYINDISNAIPGTKIKLFADDTNLFLCDRNLDDLYHKASLSLEQLSKWFIANKLSLNVDKTFYSIFGAKFTDLHNRQLKVNGSCIRFVESCKYLGVIIDLNLHWHEHIDFVYKKIIRFTSIFYKIRTKLNPEILRLLYFAFVFPHLLYGIEIYGNTFHSHLNKLIKLNNKLLRILQNKPRNTHNTELYKQYNTLPLPSLHNYQLLLLVHKCIHHLDKIPAVFKSYFTHNSSVHQYDTRTKSNLFISSIHTTFGKRALMHKCSVLWNQLPEKLKITQSTSVFKSQIKYYLIETTA